MTDLRCQRCGLTLTRPVAGGLCPRCLLESGLEDSSPPDATAHESPSRTGTEGGDFELLEEIGAGGMGTVWKAWQKSLDRTVALKLIQPQRLRSATALERFRWEAEAAARLQHPNIVAIYGLSTHEGAPCMVMELVEGRSLAEVALAGPVDPRRAAQWVRTLAETVQHAHQHGILHRDLKPSNVLLDNSGRIRIADFGLARRLDDSSGLTLSGEVLGSPGYIAPEQVAGSRGAVTTAVDIYSLGAILYELLTGQPPFAGASPAEAIDQALRHEPAPPRQRNPSVPADLETICLKCLEKEPARRYGSAQEVADELGRFLQGEPLVARPLGAAGRLWRWTRRNRLVAALALTSLALLLVVAVVSTVAAWRLGQAERVATSRLYAALLAQAQAGRWSERPGRRFQSLDVLTQAAQLAPRLGLGEADKLVLRNEAIACLALADLRPAGAWPRLESERNQFLSLDDSLETYTTHTAQGWLVTRRLADDVETARFRLEGEPFKWVRPSGRDDWLAVKFRDGRFQLWNLAQSQSALTLRSPLTEALAFSPDGARLAVDQPDRSILVYDLEEHHRQVLEPPAPLQPNWLQFSPSGQRLAVSSDGPPVVHVWTLAGARARVLTHPAFTLQVAWAPDDRTLAVACADHRIYLWDIDTGRAVGVLEGHEAVAHRVAFHPSGRALVSWGWDGVTRLWDPWNGQMLLTLPGPEPIRFSKDGSRLALRESLNVAVWEVELGHESRRLHPPPPARPAGQSACHFVAFSTDGRWLAAALSGGACVWDTHDLERAAFVPVQSVECVAFHPATGELMIGTRRELLAYSITTGGADHPIVLSPARVLELPGGQGARRIQFDRTGRRMAVERWGAPPARGRLAQVWEETETGRRLLYRLDRPAFHELALSPDGRWAAAGNWHGADVRVWDLTSGAVATNLPAAGSAHCMFSPDGRWLVTSTGGEYQFWKPGTWERAHHLAREQGGDFPGTTAFAAGGSVMALAAGRYRLRLVNAETGRELATFDPPQLEEAGWLALHPAGTLLAVASGAGGLRVWDLARLRARLQPLGLDWVANTPDE